MSPAGVVLARFGPENGSRERIVHLERGRMDRGSVTTSINSATNLPCQLPPCRERRIPTERKCNIALVSSTFVAGYDRENQVNTHNIAHVGTMEEPQSSMFAKLIDASHILHLNHVLDAFGHISVRKSPERFILSRNMAPATVSTHRDLVEYSVATGEPVDTDAPPGFVERYIHSEIYKRYPSVKSIVHSHSEAVLPFTIIETPLRPCYHMAGFLGRGAPMWDIAHCYQASDTPDLLVRNTTFGSDLAEALSPGDTTSPAFPQHRVLLMRGHGFVAVAESIEECVMTAVYAHKNALIQSSALASGSQVQYLSEAEAFAAGAANAKAVQRPWRLWCSEVATSPLYKKEA